MHDPLGQLRLRFAGLELRTEGPQGQVYAGRDFTGADVTVAVLADEAAADPDRKRAFGAAVRQRESEDPAAMHSVDLYASRPWAAVRSMPGRPGAEALLAAVHTPAGGFESQDPQPSVFQPAAQPAFQPAAQPAAQPAVQPATRPATAGQQQAGRPVVAATAAILVLVGGAAFYLLGNSGDDGTGRPAPAAPTTPAVADPTSAAGDPATSALRDVEPVSVIGPVWEPGDDTYTMAFPGWPFAFRTPSTWQCVMGVFEPIPEALAWQCVDTDQAGDGQRVNVMLWECPTTCTDAEQEDMIEAWLDEPDLAVPAGTDRTVYVETQRNARDRYSVDLSHFAPDPADANGPLRWHVGVYIESPFETRDATLKILNDIITQSS
jgi:hypothetical protein